MRSSNKFLTIAVILLLLVNITLVIFLVTGKSHPDNSHIRLTPFEMMMKDLGMNDAQKKSFDQYREEHLTRIRPLMDSVRAAKAVYFGMIKDASAPDSTLGVYGKRITDLQSDIYKLTYAHFQRVRGLFEGDQQKKYDDYLQKMLLRRDTTGKKKDTTDKAR